MSDLLEPLIRHYSDLPRAKDMFNFAAALPPSLEFVQVPIKIIPPSRVRNLRTKFRLAPSIKKNFFIWLGTSYATELQSMGIHHFQIDEMVLNGHRPKDPYGQRLDFTIDHILSLSLGGTNQLPNLCLLSGKINHLKNILEHTQIEDPRGAAKDGLLTTIMPRLTGNIRCPVPYIEGGYQIRIENAGRQPT